LFEVGQDLNLPVPTLPPYVDSVEAARQALLKQAAADQQLVDTKHRPPYESWMIKPPVSKPPLSSYHYCRLLLSHLGFLLFERRAHFHELENSARCQRSLAQLDRTLNGREMLKIGVLYVKEGQDDQKVILSNDSKSPLYREFVRGLGWTIDVAQHRGYLGGLDPKLTTGTHSPYFANSLIEVIFHEVTSMPTAADPQQIHKKRHVGNDIVHIVYSDHMRDYSSETITSQFNDAHIIVYPLSNGLFRIQIYKKENVMLFGPLLHGMTVNKKLLPMLVRLTAIQANRYVRYNTEGYTRPYPTRRKAIEEIVKRYKVPKAYDEIMPEFIQPSVRVLEDDKKFDDKKETILAAANSPTMS